MADRKELEKHLRMGIKRVVALLQDRTQNPSHRLNIIATAIVQLRECDKLIDQLERMEE